MSNSKYEATFGPRPTPPTKRELRRAARRERTKRLPLPAKIGAGVLLALVLVVWPVSCAVSGNQHQACVDKLVAERGFDQPNQQIIEECR